MKRLSLYVKGGEQDAGYYYRFHKYLIYLNLDVKVNKMYSDRVYLRYLPVAGKPFYIKILMWIYTASRVASQLVFDCFNRPDIIVISRRLVSRLAPAFFNKIVTYLSNNGTTIIWDFDDNILETKECDCKSFNIYCKIAKYIVLASPSLIDIIPSIYKKKVIVLPSTDGELYDVYSSIIQEERIKSYNLEIRVVWLGTQISLPYVEEILPLIEKAGEILEKAGKKLVLSVICDKGIDYCGRFFYLRNIKWSRDVAVKELCCSHIGIMPLDVNSFTKGKGGFKLIQYMSIALPVIGTDVGINSEIISCDVGFKPKGLDDDLWSRGICSLGLNLNRWKAYSKAAQQKYIEKYSYTHNLNIWRIIVEKA